MSVLAHPSLWIVARVVLYIAGESKSLSSGVKAVDSASLFGGQVPAPQRRMESTQVL